jgi:hypothetical protein
VIRRTSGHRVRRVHSLTDHERKRPPSRRAPEIWECPPLHAVRRHPCKASTRNRPPARPSQPARSAAPLPRVCRWRNTTRARGPLQRRPCRQWNHHPRPKTLGRRDLADAMTAPIAAGLVQARYDGDTTFLPVSRSQHRRAPLKRNATDGQTPTFARASIPQLPSSRTAVVNVLYEKTSYVCASSASP